MTINKIINLITFNWLTGPIFDKELRVSSRRKRNYFVRLAYIILLTITASLVWAETVAYYNPVFQASRMSMAGIAITCTIVWFQFIATQIVAVVMLSTAISDEIYHKTLATLMTTPITSFQIVMGKLLSKLLQILMLIAISFPLLSIIRVFGGIPWNYIISSFCLTISTVILVGSLSLFYSIFTRKAYVSIILTLLTLFMLYMVFPGLAAWMLASGGGFSEDIYFGFFGHTNPYFSMGINTSMIENRAAVPFFFSWPLACSLILAFAAGLIAFSVNQVRNVARRQASGRANAVPRPAPVSNNSGTAKPTDQPYQSKIRTVKYSPVLWKEMRSPLLGKGKVKVMYIVGIIISLIPILIVYAIGAHEGGLDDRYFHMFMVTVFMSVGCLFTLILPATCITSEKESRSWHLLLATTLSGWQIVFGKAIGSFRRCMPAWCFLFGHVIVFTLCGFIHALALLQMIIIVGGMCALLTGSGIYFSTLFKRTTTAVIMNIIFAAVIWLGILWLIVFIQEITDADRIWNFAEIYYYSIPFVQAVESMDITAHGIDNIASRGELSSAMLSTLFMLLTAALNTATGLFMAWRAKKRFRKKIF
ncbi:MAG: ABC transporter permease subunit [Phycisphaerae bacterium]|nr:ABC transporter permease subunit [Phycisphaerae bacterium]